MAKRNQRRLLSQTDIAGGLATRQARELVEAKLLAGRLLSELARLECPPAQMGTALAIVVGAIAAQIRGAAREDFYERFLSAARAYEEATAGSARDTTRH